MLYFEPELVDADHLINIQAKNDGLHITMTNHVKEVVKYKNGDVRVVGKPYSNGTPYYIHSGWDGFARIHNNITDEVEEFNTAQAYLNAAQAAGVTIRSYHQGGTVKLTGSAKGNSYRELLQEAHRQAGAFFEREYELVCEEAVATTEYGCRIDGSMEPYRTWFEADFVATLVGE